MNKILSELEVKRLNSKKGLIALLSNEPLNTERALRYIDYQKKTREITN